MFQINTLLLEVLNTLPNSTVVVAFVIIPTVTFILTIVLWENCRLRKTSKTSSDINLSNKLKVSCLCHVLLLIAQKNTCIISLQYIRYIPYKI